MSQTIVFLERDTIAPEVVVRRPSFAHGWTDYDRTTPEQLVERLKDATIAVVNKVRFQRPALETLGKLKLIAVAATGTDNIDLKACAERGVTVSNIRGYALHTVPEHAFALILALRRGLIGYRQDVVNGEWQKAAQFCFFNHPISDLHGQRLGIIGEGVIGQGVANIARAFGMHVMFAAHKGVEGLGPLYTPWDEVIETSDVITLHSPLTPQTRNMIALPEFKQMKRNLLLVNTARGGLVNEEDLAKALREKLIAGAGIDVTSPEPPPADSTLMKLLDLPNFILTPHTAWASQQAIQSLSDQLIDNIEAFVAGKPRNVVGV
ncbi:MAG: D-2-hydroxyacid dehydrogenase [Alphaproteobacteria bacterium]|nr:D-2-hydroxyacid dehydrogenase [Alphaproteobacteria bacterium]